MTLLGSQVAHADSVEVKPGDTLSSIAQAHNTTVDSLANINGISNINLIIAGETIYTSPDDVKTSGVQYTQPVEVATPSVDNTVQQSVQTQAPVAQEAVPVQEYTGDSSSAKEWIAQKESGGSYSATNGRYICRYQLDASYLNGDYSEANQERVADSYVAGRYGSWENARNFWLANGWY